MVYTLCGSGADDTLPLLHLTSPEAEYGGGGGGSEWVTIAKPPEWKQ